MEERGHSNPISIVTRDAVAIFSKLGFAVASGPEIETEHYNFDALNVPKDHPARDMWDTFWLKSGNLLRTHTSPVQIRYLENNNPPVRIISPGKVFRYEATDATHEAQFNQLEGLAIDKDLSLAQMKYTLDFFFREFFDSDVKSRFRPSYFPFVEPGVEVDISCFACHGDKTKGVCSVCKNSDWIEIMGAGMVNPKVLNGVGVDYRKWQGFAFGMGIERLAMLKYGINDIRLFNSADLRFVNQF